MKPGPRKRKRRAIESRAARSGPWRRVEAKHGIKVVDTKSACQLLGLAKLPGRGKEGWERAFRAYQKDHKRLIADYMRSRGMRPARKDR